MSCMCIYIYIYRERDVCMYMYTVYIYIYRERETCVYIYIYTYIHTYNLDDEIGAPQPQLAPQINSLETRDCLLCLMISLETGKIKQLSLETPVYRLSIDISGILSIL